MKNGIFHTINEKNWRHALFFRRKACYNTPYVEYFSWKSGEKTAVLRWIPIGEKFCPECGRIGRISPGEGVGDMDNPQKKRGLSNLLEILLLIGMVAVLAVLVSLPWTIPALTGQHPGMEGNWFYKHLTVLLVTGILVEPMLWQARSLMCRVGAGKPFGAPVSRALRCMGVECLLLAAFYAVAFFWLLRVIMLALAAALTVAGLMLFVFAELMQQAGEYKKENDMTI